MAASAVLDIKLVSTPVTITPAAISAMVDALSEPPNRFSTASAMTLPPPDTSRPLAKPWAAAKMTSVFQSISASVFFRGMQPLVMRIVAPSRPMMPTFK